MSSKRDVICSFCGKSNWEALVMIEAAPAYICDECVDRCMDMVLETYARIAERSDLLPPNYWGA